METESGCGGNCGAGVGGGEEFRVAGSGFRVGDRGERGAFDSRLPGPTRNSELETRNQFRTRNPELGTWNSLSGQSGHHGDGGAAGELRQFAEGAQDLECALGWGNWRAENHGIDQRARAANSSSGR